MGMELLSGHRTSGVMLPASPRRRPTDPQWWQHTVVYEIYVRSFRDSNGDGIGDINGITRSLPYLRDLGVGVLWLTPIFPSPNVDNGYDVSDYDAINPEFGTMDDFMTLVDRAHAMGMKIMLDQVLNHSSSKHPWFRDALARGRNSPYYDYYYWAESDATDDAGRPMPPRVNNWGSFVGGSAWTYVPRLRASYLHMFDREQPDLNWTNPRLRQELFFMLSRWLDRGVDGFRFDVINLIDKGDFRDSPVLNREGFGDVESWVTNGLRVCDYLDELYARVLRGRDTITVGETGNVRPEHSILYAPLASAKARQTPRLNMVFQFEQSHIDKNPDPTSLSLVPFHPEDLRRVISRWQTGLAGRSWNSLYWSNHDQPRVVSRFGDDTTEESRYRSATMLATILYGLQGTPYIYQGEEIGMTNFPFSSQDEFRDEDSLERYDYWSGQGHDDEEIIRYLRRFSRDNARTPFQWDGTRYGGFSTHRPWIAVNPNYGTINARRDILSDYSIYRYYQGLIRLRRQRDVVVSGVYREMPSHGPVIMYARDGREESLIVAANMSAEERDCRLPLGRILYGNYPGRSVERTHLRPYEAVWIKTKRPEDASVRIQKEEIGHGHE